MKRMTTLLILLLVLTGCTPKITSGEVISKEFNPAHVKVMTVPVVTTDGKTSTTTVVPYTYYYPDRYWVTISGIDEDGQKCTESFCVTKEVYDSVTIGEEFVYTDAKAG